MLGEIRSFHPSLLQVNAYYTTPPPILRLGGLKKYDVDKPCASINDILYNWLMSTGEDKVNPVCPDQFPEWTRLNRHLLSAQDWHPLCPARKEFFLVIK